MCESSAAIQDDHILVHGAAGFALEHLEKAMKLVEDLGSDEKGRRIRKGGRPNRYSLEINLSISARSRSRSKGFVR